MRVGDGVEALAEPPLETREAAPPFEAAGVEKDAISANLASHRVLSLSLFFPRSHRRRQCRHGCADDDAEDSE